MKINVFALALSLGLIWAIGMLMLTVSAMYTGYGTKCAELMASMYPFYDLSWSGAAIGAFEGFLDGFIAGGLIASFYNFFSRK